MAKEEINFPDLAAQFRRDYATHKTTKVPTIVYWSEKWWVWGRGKWNKTAQHVVEALVSDWSKEKGYDLRPRYIEEVAQQLSWDTLLTVKGMGEWIGVSQPMPEVIAFQDGLLDVDYYIHTGEYRMLPPDPRWFSAKCCPFAFSPHAECPRWYWALDSWFGDDDDLKSTLQEMFGYLLSDDTSAEKMFILSGKAGGGKSTATAALRSMLGEEHCHSSSIEALGTKHGTAPLIDKTLCELPDQRSVGQKRDESLSTLLKIVGGDSTRIEGKYQDEYSKVLPTRFVMACNDIPNLHDHTGAWLRRLIMVPYLRSHSSSPDTNLKSDVMLEAPGIAVWALAGLRRLRKNGMSFTEGIASLEMKAEYEDDLNPCAGFANECLTIKADVISPKEVLWRAWTEYCNATGRNPGTDNVFFRNLYGVHPDIGKTRVKANGERIYMVKGCVVKPKWVKRKQ